ncbi:MAG: ATP-dependent DNA helicase RecG [Phycisphaerales bacterium]|nr:ATP-dependent DNA helicase RecG [Phycisphaerales bacterium]
MRLFRADSPIQYVRGVGPRRAEWFAQHDLRTIGDLLDFFPTRYVTQGGPFAIENLQPGMTARILADVLKIRHRPTSLVVLVHDGTDAIQLRWFQPPPIAEALRPGMRVSAEGRVQEFDDRIEMIQPLVEFVPEGGAAGNEKSVIVGVYPGVAEKQQPRIRDVVATVLAQSRLPIAECVPPPLLARRRLMSRHDAVRAMHAPKDMRQADHARRSLAYEEFLLIELAMMMRRAKRVSIQTAPRIHLTPEIDQRIRKRFPFELTSAQNGAIREIGHDLQAGRPMTRLLQGDVGCGKTVVALYACLAAIASGFQAAIMAPTEILASQHFAKIEQYLAGSRVRRALLRGAGSRADRAAGLAKIDRGEIDLVVGTHALIQKDVAFQNLALVVVDEQHRFGVLQRHAFRSKGPTPHYLVMTATPIPRTLSMTVFGDLDVSTIRSSPPGRGKVHTRVITPDDWQRELELVRARIDSGEQVYVVCPRIGAGEEEENSAAREPRAFAEKSDAPIGAVKMAETLQAGPFRGLPLAVLHGRMTQAEKDRIMREFAAGKIRALVSTTIVEVGVDVPNATIMVIENAERYGLSQLHQLRGRVCRGVRDGLCLLVRRDRGEAAGPRLQVMTRTLDGFRIAEEDLKLRGPGELFGTKQHGLPELHMGDLAMDFPLVEAARDDAAAIVRDDPQLKKPPHQALLAGLRKMFGEKLALIDAA